VSVTHPLSPETLDCLWPDEAACQAWAATLAAQPGITDCVIALHGPLGAGKTTLVRHLLRALGVGGRIKSPTYAVMEPYTLPGGADAAHFDFYRFGDPREWVDAGFRDVFARPGLKIAEWPEKVAGLLPQPDLQLTLEPLDESARRVSVQAGTATGRALLAGLRDAAPGDGA
jgi:tRNA threonylcarbamoyladenosine biosynthesis protein TsaE